MRVKCISDVGPCVAAGGGESTDDIRDGGRNGLTVGREYLVYAVEAGPMSAVEYYICDDEYTYYPPRYPAELFDVIDGSIPDSWTITQWRYADAVTVGLFPSEWASDRYFYDRLTDAESSAMTAWWRMKAAIEERQR